MSERRARRTRDTAGAPQEIQMTEFLFLFEGGPLDGSAVHYDDEKIRPGLTSQVSDPGRKLFADTKGGQIGTLFEAFNPFMPTDPRSNTSRYNLHVYKVVRHDTSHPGKPLIISKHVRPAGDKPPAHPEP